MSTNRFFRTLILLTLIAGWTFEPSSPAHASLYLPDAIELSTTAREITGTLVAVPSEGRVDLTVEFEREGEVFLTILTSAIERGDGSISAWGEAVAPSGQSQTAGPETIQAFQGSSQSTDQCTVWCSVGAGAVTIAIGFACTPTNPWAVVTCGVASWLGGEAGAALCETVSGCHDTPISPCSIDAWTTDGFRQVTVHGETTCEYSMADLETTTNLQIKETYSGTTWWTDYPGAWYRNPDCDGFASCYAGGTQPGLDAGCYRSRSEYEAVPYDSSTQYKDSDVSAQICLPQGGLAPPQQLIPYLQETLQDVWDDVCVDCWEGFIRDILDDACAYECVRDFLLDVLDDICICGPDPEELVEEILEDINWD